MKITIFVKRESEFTPKEGGDVIKGFMYGGYSPKGKIIEWFSKKTYPVTEEAEQFDEKIATDVPLFRSVWNGKEKWKEAQVLV